jgi:uncharacterized membrane protein
MDNFIYDYFIRPIWEHSGYNAVNTVAYAAIALASVYLIYLALKGRVKMDGRFVAGALAFVLFGSTMRVVTDSIDSKVFAPVTQLHAFVLDSHILDYGYLTVTPGIYIVTAALYLASLWLGYKFGKPMLPAYAGLILWLPLFLLLVPFMGYAAYALPVLGLAAIPAYAAWLWLKDRNLAAIVAGQALDGAATFFVIDVFSRISGIAYFEQHVLSSAIGDMFGTYFVFYIIKVSIALAAAYVLSKEKEDIVLFSLPGRDVTISKQLIALVLMIIGFAPGIRDMLRMVVGA